MNYLTWTVAIVFISGVLLLGEALAIVVGVSCAWHIYRGRPAWYSRAVIESGVIGGLACSLLVLAADIVLGIEFGSVSLKGIWVPIIDVGLAGLGWGSVGPALMLSKYRFELPGPPL